MRSASVAKKRGILLPIEMSLLLNQFLHILKVTYPIYRMPQATESELGSVPGLPTTFLVSPEGKVEARQVGSVTAEMIENFIVKWEAKQVVLR